MIEQVLFVDDEGNVRKCLDLMLKSFGYKVTLAENGQDAFQKFQEQMKAGINPLILTDLRMPVLDGRGLAKLVRETYTDSKTPIIALTGWGSTLDESSRTYFDDVLPKPIQLEVLGQTLKKYSQMPTAQL